ncbi:MAG: hypothetical protein ACHQHN_16985 [Sphingobacteriales bacterium]
MQRKYIAIIIGMALSVAACKKDYNAPVEGKWQQIKLRTYTKSYQGVISNDTTYQKSLFNSSNYAQFNNNGTCIIGIFYPPGSIDPRSAAAYLSTVRYNYSHVGNKYVLTTPATLTNPGGFGEADTVSVNNNTLLIHYVFDGHVNYTISDAYYTR